MPSVNPRIVLEVCVASVEDAIAAQDGGADRLELNMALELGGLTPTAGLLQEAKQAVEIPVIVMIRPRGAGFCYSPHERQLMMRDAELLLSMGADGIAVGGLLSDGTIDCGFLDQMRDLSAGRELVFHRAFDMIANQEAALKQLIDHGANRVLTAGGCVTAVEGQQQIAKLRQVADSCMEILPGGGISADNVIELLRATGCDQVHGSFGTLGEDPAGSVADANYPRTCQTRVAQTRANLSFMSRDA
jgi:copper homeostasis protein